MMTVSEKEGLDRRGGRRLDGDMVQLQTGLLDVHAL